jgi:type I protein arginine methyltransferase
VEPNQICSQHAVVATFDMKTMRKDDACFDATFNIPIVREDYVHALVSYFDVTFNDCHKPLGFSTSPHARATHWKQTVFYLNDTLIVNPGDAITVDLSFS